MFGATEAKDKGLVTRVDTVGSRTNRYRQNAIDCLRLASEANDPGAKAVLLDMAQSWVRLADQAQKNLRTDLVYETPPRVPADDPPAKPSPD